MAVKKWPVYLFLVILVMFIPVVSAAASPVRVTKTDQLLQLLRQSVAKEYKIPTHDVLIIWNDQDLEAKLAKWGSGLAIEVTEQDLSRLVQKTSLLLKVVDGTEYKGRVPVRVVVDGWIEVYQSSRLIRKGETLSPEALESKRLKLSSLTGQYVRAPFRMEDYLTRQEILPKTVLTLAMLLERPLVERGAIVRIVVINQNLRLVARGEALESGARDSYVRVKITNFGTEKTVRARVTGEGEVTLDIDA